MCKSILVFFFFNDTATTEFYTLSLHDALPISLLASPGHTFPIPNRRIQQLVSQPEKGALHASTTDRQQPATDGDRKSTRLNSSHVSISYAVFCLKKKTTALIHHSNVLKFSA